MITLVLECPTLYRFPATLCSIKAFWEALYRFPSTWSLRTKLWDRHDAPRAFYE